VVDRVFVGDRDKTDVLALWIRSSHASRSWSPQPAFSLNQPAIPRNVIGIRVRIDEKPNGLSGQPPQRGKNAFGLSWRTRIHDKGTFVANLHDDVGACTREHVHLTLDRKNLDALNDERWGRRGQRYRSNRLLPECARACD
jgi:hypothetical protein